MNAADRRSLLLHLAVAEKLRREPELWAKVRRNLVRMKQSPIDGLVHGWALRWEQRLQAPVDDVLGFVSEDSALAQQYRSSSPFAGVLTAAERQTVLARAQREARAA